MTSSAIMCARCNGTGRVFKRHVPNDAVDAVARPGYFDTCDRCGGNGSEAPS